MSRSLSQRTVWHETKRLVGVLEQRLTGRDFIMGSDYTTVDMMIFPWVRALKTTYEAETYIDVAGV